MALGRGTWSPRLGAPARGDVCPPIAGPQPSWLGTGRTSLEAVSQGKGEGSSQAGGDGPPPTPQSLASLGEWRQQGPAQPRVVDTASVWGYRAIARLRRGRPAKQEPPSCLLLSGPSLLHLQGAAEEEQEGRLGLGSGVRGPRKRLGGSPKALTGLASEGKDPGRRRPQPGVEV